MFWILFLDLLFWKQQPSWRIPDILVWLELTEDYHLNLLVMDLSGITHIVAELAMTDFKVQKKKTKK